MQVAQNGLRTSPDHGDGAGTRQSYQRLPDGHRWLRITREKNVWTAWRSADGATWSFGARHFNTLPASVCAGIVFRALPQDAQMYFRASVSNLTLESGSSLNSTVKPLAATGTSSSQLTGLAVAPSDPNIIIVRTSHEGLLRSTDGGKTWAPANGHLQGASNAVRSVAIHPTNPLIMLRASGRADSKGDFKGGLYRTNDGGKTWKDLLLQGDFAGLGPSAL